MGFKAVTFSGGVEPLLYKHLPKVIDVLAAGGVRIAALTNGSNPKGCVAMPLLGTVLGCVIHWMHGMMQAMKKAVAQSHMTFHS